MSAGGKSARSLAEWVTLAISAVVVGSLLVIALVEEARLEDVRQANITITFDSASGWTAGEKHYVPYSIVNHGSSAVSSAEFWIEIYDDERVVESAQITAQFLPLRGRQAGVYVTTLNPADYSLRARLESVQFP